MHIGCAYTISGFELSTISEMPMNKASGFLYCDYLGCLLYNSSLNRGTLIGSLDRILAGACKISREKAHTEGKKYIWSCS